MRATVPGSVQTAILENGLAPTPWYEGLNLQALERATVGKQSWFFRGFTVPEAWWGRRVRLRFGAVDYRAHYYLNGRHVGASEGHFASVVLDVDHALRWDGENRLAVQIDAFPYDSPLDASEGRPLAAQVARTQVVANLQRFDFVAPSCPLGITHDVHLLLGDVAMIEDLWVRYSLDADYAKAAVTCQVTVHSVGDTPARLEIAIRPEGSSESVTTSVPVTLVCGANVLTAPVEVASPQLWWPNGYGPQNLYEVRAALKDLRGRTLHEEKKTIGFRKLEMAFNEGHDMSPYPWTFVINGKKIYAKGAGWVPMSPLHAMEAHRYEQILRQAQVAHFTMIRWWGGGVQERPAFYDWCDRLGLMVFQDFFLANNEHDNPRFLKLIDTQAPAFVKRLRNHPCVVLWTGGNELFNGTVNYYAQEKLWKVVEEHDPDRPFYPSSPAIGAKYAITDYSYNPDRDYATANRFGADPELRMKMLSGAYPDWEIIGQPQNAYYQSWIARLREKGFDPNDPAHRANAFDLQITAEGGASAVANLSTLQRIVPTEELGSFNGHKPSPSWLYHNAKPGSYDWLQHAQTERFFGSIEELDTYVTAGQFARAQILAYGLEEMRRRKFRFGGTLMWQLNESWPNAAGNALVDNFGTPRITYDFVQRAYLPVQASLRFDRIKWAGGEDFAAELWTTSDLLKGLPGCTVDWKIVLASGKEVAEGSAEATLAPNSSVKLGAVEWAIPAGYDSFFVVYLTVRDGHTKEIIATQEYIHSAHTSSEHFHAPILSSERTTLKLICLKSEDASATYRVENTGARNALLCRIALDTPEGVVVTRSINSFCLAPGANQTVTVEARPLRGQNWKPAWETVVCHALNGEARQQFPSEALLP
jgi:beta-mannosidase